MALPLMVLYEIGLWCLNLLERNLLRLAKIGKRGKTKKRKSEKESVPAVARNLGKIGS